MGSLFYPTTIGCQFSHLVHRINAAHSIHWSHAQVLSVLFYLPCTPTEGYEVAQLVQATNRKVAGSIPDGVTGIFQ
jgi:hypothetical protein